MNETIKSVIELVLFAIITGCGVVVVKKFLVVLNGKIDELQSTAKLSQYAQLNKYIDDAQRVITTAVTSVSQTYVDSLKTSGSFDHNAQIIAKDKAMSITKNLISEDSKSAIKTLFGDLEMFLDSTIEATVKNLK